LAAKAITVIIDGYNAINLMRFFKDKQNMALEEKRDKFINIILNLSYQTDKKYLIVFDGYTSAGRTAKYGDNLSVIFSGGKIADVVIQKMTFSDRAMTMEIISSDNEIISICRNRGAQVYKIDKFEKTLELLNERLNSDFIREKGGNVILDGNTLKDSLSSETLSKLNKFAEDKKREEAALEKREREKLEKERKQNKEKPVKYDPRAEEELFLSSMGDGARRVKSKTADFDRMKNEPEKTVKEKDVNKKGKDVKRENRDGLVREKDGKFDWTSYIDDSFNVLKPKKH